MVSLKREGPASGPVITGFAGNGFRVDNEIVDGGLWLTPEWARPWAADDVAALDAKALDPLLSIEPLPEFLLLGTGASLQRPSPSFVAAVEAKGIGVEAMDSRAAARSWSLLRAEDRWFVAALLPLD
ncbi:MTH938/NDUFAF3 family protein [Parasphingopyxis sp.]|uniref:MTH938/NDUFAF3 family protein n=1 Tax=Parasphingopyxis sp. TaxID=1920299 RepID=UPI00260D19C9|nr:MTH938/NDUFAF3 family protein [Parasphingopyxis sp.]